jgi:exodeoxyribonuclease VII small subunit
MTSDKKTAPDTGTFESTIDSLEALVAKLENPETSLEDSLAAFESGIGLTRRAQKTLLAAEQKVQLLSESEGEPKTSNFDPDGGHE